MKAISLFSGAGGLDQGLTKAGFEVIFANDHDKNACATYAKNIGNHIVHGDIDNFKENLLQHRNKIDLIAGGPPCQGFSVAGKMNPDDPRSKHVWTFAELVSKILPNAFIMENVKALGTLQKWEPLRKSLIKKFRESGYATNFIVLNSSEFNVPQNRYRVFFIGFKTNRMLIPDLKQMLEPYKKKAPTVREAISILDRAGTGNNTGLCKAKITLTSKPVMRKSPYAGMLFNGAGRPTRLDGYSATLPASMGGNKTPIIDELELYENAESWVEKYHKGLVKGKQPSEYKEAPKRLRRLTYQEAAILQTFPIDYDWQGSQSSIFKQIGNAVPCNLGYRIGKMIMDCLLQDEVDKLMIALPHQLEFANGNFN
ncbi:MAG TPA: DNA (cytosine-5-)-methyltransferase [Bacteroidetes bacterium]|nr:DNA (cytosine-5-)-methyltransferase [Bacteroidota bacterium]